MKTTSLRHAALSFVLVAGLVPGAALAGEQPDPAAALQTITYYFDGKDDGPVLMDAMACLKVDDEKGSDTRYECLEPLSGTVAKNTRVYGWTKWLVPKGGVYEDVMIQFLHDGMVRTTKDVKLTESLRMRTYRSEKLTKAGEWEIKIIRGSETLKSFKVTVTE